MARQLSFSDYESTNGSLHTVSLPGQGLFNESHMLHILSDDIVKVYICKQIADLLSPSDIAAINHRIDKVIIMVV